MFQYKLTVPKVGCVSDLCASLSALSGISAEQVSVRVRSLSSADLQFIHWASSALSRWWWRTSTTTGSTGSSAATRTWAASWSGTTSSCELLLWSVRAWRSAAVCLMCSLSVWSRFELTVGRLENTQHVLIPVHLREKYKQSGFNHTSTPLFGRPFLLSVPRSVSEDKLYNLLLLRLWYILTHLWPCVRLGS